jgi:oligosaccharyltransferase complex subunit epsilon
MMKQDVGLLSKIVTKYQENTPNMLKIMDTFLVFIMFTGVIQFEYMIIIGTYPYNAFLSGFITSVGMFCNTGILLLNKSANLRIQLHPQNQSEIKISPERAYADFAFSSVVLFVFAICFVG